jgi:hypothetical protein
MANSKTLGTIIRINDTDIGGVLALGTISLERNTKEYRALNKEEVDIVVGSVKSGSYPIKVKFDPDDTAAQGALKDAVLNAKTVKLEIELADKKTDSGNGTKFTWENAAVDKLDIEQDEDGFNIATFNVLTPGLPTITAAS